MKRRHLESEAASCASLTFRVADDYQAKLVLDLFGCGWMMCGIARCKTSFHSLFRGVSFRLFPCYNRKCVYWYLSTHLWLIYLDACICD